MCNQKDRSKNSQHQASMLSLFASKRHILHAVEEGRIAAIVGSTRLSCEAAARLAVACARSCLLTVADATGGRVGVGSWISPVVCRWSAISRAGWIVCTVIHRATASSHVGVTTSKGTVATVHLLWILLALCPRRHAIGGLRGVGWKLMRESVVAIVIIGLRSVVAVAAFSMSAAGIVTAQSKTYHNARWSVDCCCRNPVLQATKSCRCPSS